ALMPGPDDTGPGDEKNETYAVIGAASSSPQVTEQLKQLIQQAVKDAVKNLGPGLSQSAAGADDDYGGTKSGRQESSRGQDPWSDGRDPWKSGQPEPDESKW
ncbi:unnamed protein product, partial [Prorocentrum cordatum]